MKVPKYLIIALLVAACATVSAENVPPAGQVWFGSSFDAKTYAMTGRTDSVTTTQPVALVAHLTRNAEPGLTIRASKDGTFVTSAPVAVNGSGDVVGLMLGALVVPGAWTYDLTDVGGNVLATGTVTAR